MFASLRNISKIASVASLTYITHTLSTCDADIPPSKSQNIALLSGTGNPALSKAISEKIGVPLTQLKLDRFSGTLISF